MARNRNTAFIKDRTFNIINPIANSVRGGVFRLSTTTLEKYKANLYTLIFTGVGQRVMEPNFGTTIQYLLFEPLVEGTQGRIKQEIYDKVEIWIPQIEILSVIFGDEVESAENNKVMMKISFTLKLDPSIQDFIEIEMGT
jgi:phage baseplate assembly protein W